MINYRLMKSALFFRLFVLTLLMAILYRVIKRGEDTVPDKTLNQRYVRDENAKHRTPDWDRRNFYLKIFEISFSVLTLAAASTAALYAKYAVEAALESNALSKAANEAENRAWLSVDLGFEQNGPMYELVDGRTGLPFLLKAIVKNHGNSPANAPRLVAKLIFPKPGDAFMDTALSDFCDQDRRTGRGLVATIFPDEERDLSTQLVISPQDVEEAHDTNGYISPIVYGCINYESPYTTGTKQTEFQIHLGTIKNGIIHAIKKENWMDQEIVMDQSTRITAE